MAFLSTQFLLKASKANAFECTQGIIDAPDFDQFLNGSLENSIITGIRPYRRNGFLVQKAHSSVEFQTNKDTYLNYGHGGAGWTLSLGSAKAIKESIQSNSYGKNTVAIIGAGIIGLTTAWELLKAGYNVKVYSTEFSQFHPGKSSNQPVITSDVAGAQWAPSSVSRASANYNSITVDSYNMFEQLFNDSPSRWGMERMPQYHINAKEEDDSLAFKPKMFGEFPSYKVPRSLQDKVRPICNNGDIYTNDLPFSWSDGGRVYDSWIISPPVFFKSLYEELDFLGVEYIEIDPIEELSELQTYDEEIIVLCTGVGSKKLLNDRNLRGIKGELVLLKPQSHINYARLGVGYMFPRPDCIVLGGTYKSLGYDHIPSKDDLTANVADCRAFIESHRWLYSL